MRVRTLIPLAPVMVSLPAVRRRGCGNGRGRGLESDGRGHLNSIMYSGSARTGAFGQSKSIGEPMGPVNLTLITQYGRDQFRTTSDPTALVSRRAGRRNRRPARRAAADAGRVQPEHYRRTGRQQLDQALNIWTTPWGFLKGAAANDAMARELSGVQVVSFTPANMKSPSGQPYTVTGYINQQNLVTRSRRA